MPASQRWRASTTRVTASYARTSATGRSRSSISWNLSARAWVLRRPDLFKRLKLMQDVDAILAEAASMIETHHLDLDEARSVILSDMLGEQPLSLRA